MRSNNLFPDAEFHEFKLRDYNNTPLNIGRNISIHSALFSYTLLIHFLFLCISILALILAPLEYIFIFLITTLFLLFQVYQKLEPIKTIQINFTNKELEFIPQIFLLRILYKKKVYSFNEFKNAVIEESFTRRSIDTIYMLALTQKSNDSKTYVYQSPNKETAEKLKFIFSKLLNM